jgi:serine/threonine protein kinase
MIIFIIVILMSILQPASVDTSLLKTMISKHGVTIDKELGKGMFGVTVQGHREGQEARAFKVVPMNVSANAMELPFETEIEMTKQAQTMEVYSDFKLGNEFNVLEFELIKGDTLANLMQKLHVSGTMTNEIAFWLFARTAEAGKQLQDRGVYHNDFHANNVMARIDKNQVSAVSVIDFGRAKSCHVKSSHDWSVFSPQPFQQNDVLMLCTFFGTFPAVPETIRAIAMDMLQRDTVLDTPMSFEKVLNELKHVFLERFQVDMSSPLLLPKNMDAKLHLRVHLFFQIWIAPFAPLVFMFFLTTLCVVLLTLYIRNLKKKQLQEQQKTTAETV